jgi:hypothetical protein
MTSFNENNLVSLGEQPFDRVNRLDVQRLTRGYTIACAGLGFEIVLWIVSLGDMLSV